MYPPLKLADQYTEYSYTVEYLGLGIYCFLLWHDHIDYITVKLAIARLKRHTNQSLRSVYYALVYPHLTYGCISWGDNYEAPLSQSVKLQSEAVRIINNVPPRDHSARHYVDHITPHYVDLGLLKLPDIIKLRTCQLFYEICYFARLVILYNSPSSLALSFVSEIHDLQLEVHLCST